MRSKFSSKTFKLNGRVADPSNFVKSKIVIILPTFSSYYEFLKDDVQIIYFKLDKNNDFALNVGYTIIVFTIGLIIYALAIVLPEEMHRKNEIRAQAEEMGCDLIGRARSLEKVWFLNCNGEVKMIYTP